MQHEREVNMGEVYYESKKSPINLTTLTKETLITDLVRKKDNWTEIKNRDQYLAFRDWISKLTQSVDSAIKEKNENYINTITLSKIQQQKMLDMLYGEFNYLFDINRDEVEPTQPHWFNPDADYNSSRNAIQRFFDKIIIFDDLLQKAA